MKKLTTIFGAFLLAYVSIISCSSSSNDNKEITEFRNLLLGCQSRIMSVALAIHNEQERVQDLIRILDSKLIKGDKND